MLAEILKHNQQFVVNGEYKQYETTKYPDKQIAIVSCMDTRLTELLPAALGFKNGDVKIIKNAGGIITHPYGSAMRSLLIGIFELGIKEVLVVGHTDCGAKNVDGIELIERMKELGISEEKIHAVTKSGVNIIQWIDGFQDLDKSIIDSVSIIRNHPLVPEHIKIHGLKIDSTTGLLQIIDKE